MSGLGSGIAGDFVLATGNNEGASNRISLTTLNKEQMKLNDGGGITIFQNTTIVSSVSVNSDLYVSGALTASNINATYLSGNPTTFYARYEDVRLATTTQRTDYNALALSTKAVIDNYNVY